MGGVPDLQEEVEIHCPFCGEAITVFVDPSISHQNYIEDCSVCCRPIQIAVSCEEGAVISLDAGQGS